MGQVQIGQVQHGASASWASARASAKCWLVGLRLLAR